MKRLKTLDDVISYAIELRKHKLLPPNLTLKFDLGEHRSKFHSAMLDYNLDYDYKKNKEKGGEYYLVKVLGFRFEIH